MKVGVHGGAGQLSSAGNYFDLVLYIKVNFSALYTSSGSAVGFPSLTSFRYGKILIDTCSAFKNAEHELSERVLRIESCWRRTSLQLDFLGQVWDDLDQEHQDI
jgi:hypothetical protein